MRSCHQCWCGGLRLTVQQVLVISCRSSNRLARIVHNNIQPSLALQQVGTKLLHRAEEAEVNTYQLQPPHPILCINLCGISSPRIFREACRGNHAGAHPEELQRSLETDFDASSGDKANAALHVALLLALPEVERRAGRTEMRVEVVPLREARLASVARLLPPVFTGIITFLIHTFHHLAALCRCCSSGSRIILLVHHSWPIRDALPNGEARITRDG
mmetsp:Transcript_132409/g.330186  ORF Transcript_132409/g.330186 Transcript_132409/m.330186 type:complete len:217 (-) Transcript_132409:701-1351(-)